jgi:hypothetical protein
MAKTLNYLGQHRPHWKTMPLAAVVLYVEAIDPESLAMAAKAFGLPESYANAAKFIVALAGLIGTYVIRQGASRPVDKSHKEE